MDASKIRTSGFCVGCPTNFILRANQIRASCVETKIGVQPFVHVLQAQSKPAGLSPRSPKGGFTYPCAIKTLV